MNQYQATEVLQNAVTRWSAIAKFLPEETSPLHEAMETIQNSIRELDHHRGQLDLLFDLYGQISTQEDRRLAQDAVLRLVRPEPIMKTMKEYEEEIEGYSCKDCSYVYQSLNFMTGKKLGKTVNEKEPVVSCDTCGIVIYYSDEKQKFSSIENYSHKDGWLVKTPTQFGYKVERRWIYAVCAKCEYQNNLGKLRSQIRQPNEECEHVNVTPVLKKRKRRSKNNAR